MAPCPHPNDAENIYSFRINRIEPLDVPLLSEFTGPFRYEFLVGPLKRQTFSLFFFFFSIDPWVHVEKVSFRPTQNVEFGFERTVILGGPGITFRSTLRVF